MGSWYPIADYRSFGGKKYELDSKHRTKSDAQKKAESLRRRGIPARVVPTPLPPDYSAKFRSSVIHKWLVYRRWTRPVKGRAS